jgi:hypothetical protein
MNLHLLRLKFKLFMTKQQLKPKNRRWAEDLEYRLKVSENPSSTLRIEAQRLIGMQQVVTERLERLSQRL